MGDADGEPVSFRIHRGSAFAAEVKTTAEGGIATAEWTVREAHGGGDERGYEFADYMIEAQCRDSVARTTSASGLRGFRRKV